MQKGGIRNVIVYFLSDMLLVIERQIKDNLMVLVSQLLLNFRSSLQKISQTMFQLQGKNEQITFVEEDNSHLEEIYELIERRILKPLKKNQKTVIDVKSLGTQEKQEGFMTSKYTVYIYEVKNDYITFQLYTRYS